MPVYFVNRLYDSSSRKAYEASSHTEAAIQFQLGNPTSKTLVVDGPGGERRIKASALVASVPDLGRLIAQEQAKAPVSNNDAADIHIKGATAAEAEYVSRHFGRIDGNLAVMGVALLILMCRAFLEIPVVWTLLHDRQLPKLERMYSGFTHLLQFSFVSDLMIGLVIFAIAVPFFMRKKITRILLFVFIPTYILLNSASIAWQMTVLTESGPMDAQTPLNNIIISVLWLGYLIGSPRARHTFSR